MARPKKEKELTHTHHLHLRLTDVEYEVVSEAAKQANLTLSEYTRRQLAGRKVTVKYEIVADVPELKKLIAGFGKTGSNLNQIARHLNQGSPLAEETLKSIRQCMAEIYEMKYEVVKMAGSFSTAGEQTDNPERNLNGNIETHSSKKC
jgi:hypothetical protein